MAKSDSNDILRPSLIDRFTRNPSGGESTFFDGVGLRELKASVARDLEWLLNTRVWMPEHQHEIANLDETRKSVLAYGIPDLSTYSWSSNTDRREIAALIEGVIRTFEPRLESRSVRVEIVPTNDVDDFSLKLRIEALLHVDPISEHVTFDSSAEIEAGGLRIGGLE